MEELRSRRRDFLLFSLLYLNFIVLSRKCSFFVLFICVVLHMCIVAVLCLLCYVR